MTVFNFPADEHHFRDQTAGQGALAGCMLPSFRCPRCSQVRRIKGRKRTALGGWMCAACHQEREYRKASAVPQGVQP